MIQNNSEAISSKIVTKLEWQSIPIDSSLSESMPSGGGIAHCIIDHERVAFFGGLGLRRFNELYIYNVNTNEWRKASMENAPSRRCKSSMCCYLSGNKHKVIIFGGWTNEGKTNDMFEYCIEDDKWSCVKYANNSIPPERSAHHCVIIGKHMIIYAGIGAKKYGDMYRFHLEKKEWEEIIQVNAPLPRSSYGGLISFNKNQNLLTSCGLGCGRYNDTLIFDISTKTWKSVSCKGSLPTKRGRHSCVLDETNNRVILWGGFTGTERSNECFQFNLSTHEWSNIKQVNPPNKRENQCLFILNQKLYLFGGWNGTEFYHDLFCTNLQ